MPLATHQLKPEIPEVYEEENGGPWGTVPELLFEKKGLIPAVQQLLISSK